MKNLIIIFLIIAFTACQNAQNSKNEEKTDTSKLVSKESVDKENLATMKFNVEGMSCTGCENAITSSIKECNGIIEVSASYKEKNAIVSFDKSKTNSDELKKAIESKGYTVEGIENVENTSK